MRISEDFKVSSKPPSISPREQYTLSDEWFRLLSDHLDALAVMAKSLKENAQIRAKLEAEFGKTLADELNQKIKELEELTDDFMKFKLAYLDNDALIYPKGKELRDEAKLTKDILNKALKACQELRTMFEEAKIKLEDLAALELADDEQLADDEPPPPPLEDDDVPPPPPDDEFDFEEEMPAPTKLTVTGAPKLEDPKGTRKTRRTGGTR